MNKLIKRFSDIVKGSITGFDRIVFKGFILPLMAARGVMSSCWSNGILNKNYKKWMMEQTAYILKNIDQYAKDNCGQGIIHIPRGVFEKRLWPMNGRQAAISGKGLSVYGHAGGLNAVDLREFPNEKHQIPI